MHTCMYMVHAHLYRRLGGGAQRPNREIDFGFGSCVRARGGGKVRDSLKSHAPPFPFPFSPGRLSLFPCESPLPQPPIQLQVALSVETLAFSGEGKVNLVKRLSVRDNEDDKVNRNKKATIERAHSHTISLACESTARAVTLIKGSRKRWIHMG